MFVKGSLLQTVHVFLTCLLLFIVGEAADMGEDGGPAEAEGEVVLHLSLSEDSEAGVYATASSRQPQPSPLLPACLLPGSPRPVPHTPVPHPPVWTPPQVPASRLPPCEVPPPPAASRLWSATPPQVLDLIKAALAAARSWWQG